MVRQLLVAVSFVAVVMAQDPAGGRRIAGVVDADGGGEGLAVAVADLGNCRVSGPSGIFGSRSVSGAG